MLDELGAPETRIVVSGDLDEFRIDELERTAGGRPPIDAYGVGTSVVTGSGHATAGFVYKLVAVADAPGADSPLRPVAKLSAGKATHGHRKVAYRVRDRDGRAVAELLSVGAPPPSHARPLHVPIVSRGEAAPAPTIDGARAHHLDARRELPDGALALQHGAPVLMPELFEGGA
jgi:nicotinate phosphoribosyltransferase